MSYSKKTNKLFFGKYVYKIAIKTPLACLFRGNNLSLIRLEIAVLEDRLLKSNGKSVRVGGSYSRQHSTREDINLAKILLKILEDSKEYNLRVEGSTLGLYANDINFITSIQSIIGVIVEEISKPASEEVKNFLLATPKAIIRKEYTHKYKVTVKALWSEASNFVEWAKKLPKIKVASNRYTYGGHFYVADEKTLSLCHIFLSDKIQKIEELVTASEI